MPRLSLVDPLIQGMIFFTKGVIVGIAVSAPIGPASIVCMRNTVQRGLLLGLSSGIGIAAADTFYGSLVGLGMTSLAEFIVGWILRVKLLGGLLLIGLGLIFYLLPPPKEKTYKKEENSYIHAFWSTFALTIANPFILFIFAAVFAAVGLENFARDVDLVGFLILGVFSGAVAWWILVCGALTFLHQKVQFRSLSWTNKASGLMIIAFGIYTLYSALCKTEERTFLGCTITRFKEKEK